MAGSTLLVDVLLDEAGGLDLLEDGVELGVVVGIGVPGLVPGWSARSDNSAEAVPQPS